MPVDVTITFQGLDEIARTLQMLGPEVSDKALNPAVRREVQKWRDAAKARAPVAPGPRTRTTKRRGKVTVQPGGLRRSIRAVKLRQPKEMRGDRAAYGVRIARRAFYWKFQEFGTSKQAARPFVRPVFDQMARDSLQGVGDNAGEWLRRYWKRMSRAK